ncbi:hypothetical protein CDAR_481171 [Caerostris darwini]|uniref:Uncharacterized protein n=1 Tax=Caerostris darwini TaxID=1538125 RepID=A0AAV4N7Q6_9ARAC|nr:hypothetical protein CDAR_481171 [Caerostris darwini]
MRSFGGLMSFPVFLVSCEIAINAFSTVLLFSDRNSASLREFSYSCPQTVLWFISMVSLADIVQSRSLRYVELVLSQAAHSEKFKMNLNYFDYKEIKRNCTLTAWNMWILNRNLLLTSFAALVTYGVIISEMKNN